MRPPEPTPAPAAAGGSGFVIQVLSTADQTKANTLLGQLRSRGFPAFIQPASTGSATTYRVRVGPFASRQAAAEKNEELKAQVGITDTWITSQ
jgi:cell division septation protein DedD